MRALKDADRNSEALDAVLRRAMREPPGAATPECADAESIAAYWDGSIGAAERERLEAHFADCARCQTQLAAIARADESARAASAASRTPWYRRWQFAIPAFAAVAAVAVFLAIRRPAVEQSRTAEVVAMAKREAPGASLPMPEHAPAPAAPVAAAPEPTAAPAAPASNEIAMSTSRAKRSQAVEPKSSVRLHRMESSENPGARALAPVPAERPSEAGRVVAIAPAAPFVASAAAQAPAQSTASSERAVNQYKMQIAQPAPSMGYARSEAYSAALPGTGAMPQAAAPVAGAGAAVGGAAVGAATGAIVGSAVGHPSAGAAVPATGQMIGAAPTLGTNYSEPWPIQAQVSTPDHSVTWIIGRNGTVQRRDANGAVHMQHSGVTTDLVAGAAPSASVCWIVGRSGTIIRTTDGGEHWTLITPPVAENLAAVSASSASDATIVTARGRRFATSDGGMSWHLQ